ncbi:MAG: hypothetical protein KA369_02800 [Spirochaetes bacterium]|nr:hypothetical protein [Spirochaetota bacterium]
MKRNDNKGDHLIELLKNIDLAYAFKKKRLRYIQYASKSKEIQSLRDNFQDLWTKKGNLNFLKDPELTQNSIEILMGLFGDSDMAEYMLNCDMALVNIDWGEINEFLNLHIASETARKNLMSILMEGIDSLVELARRQIPYFQRYIPTMKKFIGTDISLVGLTENDLDNLRHFIERIDDVAGNLKNDIQCYKKFAADFFTLYRENAEVTVVGYGEISTVMRLNKKNHLRSDIIDSESRWIWKKMPPFPTMSEVDRYMRLYEMYRHILIEDLGIAVPEQTARYFKHNTYFLVYAGQERVDEKCIGNALIRRLDEVNAVHLLEKVLKKLVDVHVFNKKNTEINIGIDAQFSNWVLVSQTGSLHGIADSDTVTYIDTSSPMIRIRGIEQVNTEIFIKSAASFLRPFIRAFFLQQVLDRYYDLRSVVIDIIANLYKEKRADLIDSFIQSTNSFFKNAGVVVKDINRKEIDAYYSNDAFIWRFYQASRKIDRFVTEKILRKQYMFRIPEAIER